MVSCPSESATITAMDASPVTFTTVRIISRILSTPRIKALPSLGTLPASQMLTSMMMPAPGTAAVPIEASTAVKIMVSCAPIPSPIPRV